jgi:hypothetical protein
MALFGLGAFGQGLVTGLATSTDKAIQGGLERVRENIDEFSSATLKREQKAIEKTEKEAEEVIEELRSAQAVLGGTNDPQSAARAAALLDNVGDLDDFKAVVSNLKEYKLNNTETYDFTKYFDTQADAGNVNLADAATNYVLGRQVPTTATPMPEMKGGGIGRLFGVDVAERARAKTDAQLAALGLVQPQEKDIALPSITFKSEAFKLDRMGPEQERTYLRDKMLDPDTPQDKIEFYRTRYSDLSNRMGLDTQIESATFQLNLEQDPAKKKNLLLNLQNLNREKKEFDVLATGNKIDILKFQLEDAMSKGQTGRARQITEELFQNGAIKVTDFIAVQEERLLADLAQGKDVQEDIDSLKNLKEIVKTTKENIEGLPDPTPAGIAASFSSVDRIVNRDLASDPKFAKAGVTIDANSQLVIPDDISPNLKIELSKARIDRFKKVAGFMENSMPNNPDVKLVTNMVNGGYSLEDVKALGEADAVVSPPPSDTLGPEYDDTAVTKQVMGVSIPENVARRTDLTDDDKVVVASTQSEYGVVPSEEVLMNLMSDIHDANANVLGKSGIQTLMTDSIKTIYGPKVAEQYAAQIDSYINSYSGFDDAALNEYSADSLEGQIVSVMRDLEKADPNFAVEQVAPIVKRQYYEGDRSVDIPGIMSTVTKLVTRHRNKRPTETGFISPKRRAEIENVREASGQPPMEETGTDSLLFDRDQMKRGLMYPLEMFGMPAPDDAPGKPVSLFGDSAPDEDAGIAPEDGGTATARGRTGLMARDTDTQPLSPPTSPKAMSIISLTTKYADGTISSEEASELRRRIEMDESGKIAEQVQGIMTAIAKGKQD